MQDCIITRKNGSGQGRTPKIDNIIGAAQKITLSPLHFSQNGNELINVQNLSEETSVSIFHDFEQQNFDKIKVLNDVAIDKQIEDFNDLISPHFYGKEKYIGLPNNNSYYLWANKDNIKVNFLDLTKCIISDAGEIYNGFYKENDGNALVIFGREPNTDIQRMWLISTVSENAVRNYFNNNEYWEADILYSFIYKDITYYISSCPGRSTSYFYYFFELGYINKNYIYDGEEQTDYCIPDFLFDLLDNINVSALLS